MFERPVRSPGRRAKSGPGQTPTSANGGPASGFTLKADPISPKPYVS
jgi:hypothetical protein